MRIASVRRPDDSRVLVSVHASVLRPVTLDDREQRWVETSEEPVVRRGIKLERPFDTRSVIAPGPRIAAESRWADRHREFHVKPSAVLADSGSQLGGGFLGAVGYRIQAAAVFAQTPRHSSQEALQSRLLGCHLLIELISETGFTLGWEGPRWHLRYGEGMSLDGACPVSPQLVTADEFAGTDLAVRHSGGHTVLRWAAVLEFAAFVNRYVELGPGIMLLAGWPSGPTLSATEGVPNLVFDAPKAVPGSKIWAESDVLGRAECIVRAEGR